MKLTSIFSLLCFQIITTQAQYKSRSFFDADSTLINTYLKSIAEKKASIFANLPKNNAKEYKAIYNSSFESIETFVKSNAPVTDKLANQYLQQLVSHIVANNSELANLSLRVIFSRDYWPNAYSMGDGTIAFNAGLLIYLQNEAELVFVLCHEIAHYYLQHQHKSIKKYVEETNNSTFQKELQSISKQEYGTNASLDKLRKKLTFNSRKHSREHEAEADFQGFKFMRNTMYNPNAFISCMQLLDKIDDSILTKPLHIKALLNSKNYPFNMSWLQEESSIFSDMNAKKEETPLNDSLKTHPDCTQRIAFLKDSIAKINISKKVFYSSNTNNFAAWKEKFYFELIEYSYQNNDLSKNLYYSLLLFQNKEDLPYAVYSIGRCFNKIYEKQKNHTLGKALDLENDNFNSDYNSLLHMLNKVSLPEIAAINYYFCKENTNFGIQYNGFEEIAKTVTKNFNNK